LNPFQLLQQTKLDSRPFAIASDDSSVVVAFANRLTIYEGKTSIPIQCRSLSCSIFRNFVVVLLENRDLLIFRGGESVKTEKAVSTFFVDTKYGLVFFMRGTKVFLLKLAGKIRFHLFMETADPVIGTIGSGCALLSVSVAPNKPRMKSYLEFAIVSQMDNPELAASMMLPVRHMPNFPTLLGHVAVNALRDKQGAKLIQFLAKFPEFKNQALASALRAVETPERLGVFEVLGPPSEIFMNFAKLSKVGEPMIEFSQVGEVSAPDMFSASCLLPVIMEEEGPLVAFPAALFVLSKMHFDVDHLESLMRFLDPLLVPPVVREDGKLSCVGMILEAPHYDRLREKMAQISDESLTDLFIKIKPTLILAFAQCFRLPLVQFCQKHTKIDHDAHLIGLIERLVSLVVEEAVDKRELNRLWGDTNRGGWIVWTAALMLAAGDATTAAEFLDQHVELKWQFKESQWWHLIEV
jgi:hypothetical protein